MTDIANQLNEGYVEDPKYRKRTELAVSDFINSYQEKWKNKGYNLTAIPKALDEYNYYILANFTDEKRFRWPWDKSLNKLKKDLPEKQHINDNGYTLDYFVVLDRDVRNK